MPAGKQVSYTFYKDFATAATEKKAAQAGGVVVSFKPDQKIPRNDLFYVEVLHPFAKFVWNDVEKQKCAIDPSFEDFEHSGVPYYLAFKGTFEANQNYVITCPDVKVELPYAKGTYTVAAAAYWNAQSSKRYGSDPKKIEFAGNAASFTTILGSVVLAASALAALF